MIGFIDPPGRFAATTQWQQFLAHMKTLPQDDPQVQAAIKQAQQALGKQRRPSPAA
jgi:hypothetical protein